MRNKTARALSLAFSIALALGMVSGALAAEVEAGDELINNVANMGIVAAPAPPERGEGNGPYSRMVIRGATLINGTGAPAFGPVDIVVENNRITQVQSVGNPGLPISESGRPAPAEYEIQAEGMYVMPGMIDSHAHIAYILQQLNGPPVPAEYVYKLWLGHGITTVREVGSNNGLGWTIEQRDLSNENKITAPRILAYAWFPGNEISTPAEAKRWVAAVKKRGADGIKFIGASPEVMRAALQEAGEQGLKTTMHHAQLAVTGVNVIDSSSWGLGSMEHWYGLPEAMFTDQRIQDYPADYNYNNEQDRFGQAGRLWEQAAEPGSETWNSVMETLLARDFTLVPTFTIYEASRDLMRAQRAEWHDDYTLPTLWNFFAPSRESHGSYWFYWTTADEVAWKRNYAIWMSFVDEYKNRGGRVAAGSDAGFIYKLYGFAYVRELELLQEAGFHPLEVMMAATQNGAELVGLQREIGTVEPGKLADLVIVEENPLANFKVLYGTGALKLNEVTQEAEKVGGVRWVVKDGIVFDAVKLREDVRGIVADAKREQAAGGNAP